MTDKLYKIITDLGFVRVKKPSDEEIAKLKSIGFEPDFIFIHPLIMDGYSTVNFSDISVVVQFQIFTGMVLEFSSGSTPIKTNGTAGAPLPCRAR
jgi:hypothetical protein